MIRIQAAAVSLTPIMCYDSTSHIMGAITDIVNEWTDLKRKGKVIIHFDGAGPRKVEFNYSIDI